MSQRKKQLFRAGNAKAVLRRSVNSQFLEYSLHKGLRLQEDKEEELTCSLFLTSSSVSLALTVTQRDLSSKSLTNIENEDAIS